MPPTKAEKPTPVMPACSMKRPAFDLSYVPPNAKGVYGFRPAVLCSHSEIQPFVARLNEELPKAMAAFGFKGEFDLKVEDIEQMTGIVEFKRMPDNKNAVMTSFTMIRTVRDFDWAKQIKTWLPGVAVCQYQGHEYFKAPKGSVAILDMGPDVYGFVPDNRTLVCSCAESAVKEMIESLGKPRPLPAWMKDWSAVDQCWLAVALDNCDFHLVHDLNKENQPPMPLTPIAERATCLVLGLDGTGQQTVSVKTVPGTNDLRYSSSYALGSNLVVTAIARCADDKSAAEVRQTVESLFKAARESTAIAPASAEESEKPTPGQVLSELLKPAIEQRGPSVAIRADSKKSLLAIKEALDALEVHADAKKE
jgi:hypothetical protein